MFCRNFDAYVVSRCLVWDISWTLGLCNVTLRHNNVTKYAELSQDWACPYQDTGHLTDAWQDSGHQTDTWQLTSRAATRTTR